MIERKTICVARVVHGVLEWLPLENQTTYREWAGCFSIV